MTVDDKIREFLTRVVQWEPGETSPHDILQMLDRRLRNHGGKRRGHMPPALTYEDVVRVRELRAKRVRYKVIAQEFPNVSITTLSRAVGGRGGYESYSSPHLPIERWNRRTDAQTTPFQGRVQPWMLECFGAAISADQQERNHRFLEESLELVQACGCTESEAAQLVSYVYGRPAGDPPQEVGGVMVTLAALCLAQGMDMHAAGEVELARIWTKVEKIRAKQAAKPKHSPLPAAAGDKPPAAVPLTAERVMELARKHGCVYTNRHYPTSPAVSFSHDKLQAFVQAVVSAIREGE